MRTKGAKSCGAEAAMKASRYVFRNQGLRLVVFSAQREHIL